RTQSPRPGAASFQPCPTARGSSSLAAAWPACTPPGAPPIMVRCCCSPRSRCSTALPPTRRVASPPRSAPATRRPCTGATRSPRARRSATPRRCRCSSRKGRRAFASCKPPAPISISTRRASCSSDATPRIRVLEKARVLNLIVRRGVCLGVRASVAGRATEIIADATVLATGGCGQTYKYTTNPVVATGDGYAIAHRAGVTLADMEFVQFHPTALDTPENPLSLVSEAVRGEGAVLVNSRGVRFMKGKHADAELAPRDVVARAIFREQ